MEVVEMMEVGGDSDGSCRDHREADGGPGDGLVGSCWQRLSWRRQRSPGH